MLNYDKYLLVIAHPDDEVNCGALLQRLVVAGKQVRLLLLTDGDAGQNPEGRIGEMRDSVAAIGLPETALTPLHVPEHTLLQRSHEAYEGVLRAATEFTPDCVLSLDYEGGHEGHDLASVIAHRVAQAASVSHVVFPDYHFRDGRRYGLEFVPGRTADYTLSLTDEEKDLKIKLLEAHSGQLGFYLRLQKTQPGYFALLFEREIYRTFPANFDYLQRPDYPLGYEHHRNGFKFEDVAAAIQQLPE